jgi:hypothetical protein
VSVELEFGWASDFAMHSQDWILLGEWHEVTRIIGIFEDSQDEVDSLVPIGWKAPSVEIARLKLKKWRSSEVGDCGVVLLQR